MRNDRRSSYAESSTSTMREDRDKKKKSKDSKSDKRRSSRSEQPASVTPTGGYRGDIVDSPKSPQRSYSEQMGSDGLSRFPGQAGAPMMSGALPVGTNGLQSSSSSQYQNQPQPQQQQQGHHYSDHVQSQFPGQDPVNFASSALPGGHPFGAAAEFYNDQGQSVGQQPGVRPQPPSVIVGQDTPHLMSASAQPNPVADTGSGAAADFYAQGPSTSSSRPPRPLSSSMPGAFVDDTPAPPKPPRPASSSRPDKPGTFGTAASMVGAAAFGYAAGHSSSSHEHSASYSSSSNVRPPSSFSSYTNTAPAAPASTYNMYGNGPNTSNSNASNGTHLPSHAAAAYGNDDIPPPKPPRPSRPEKHSSGSNAGLLAAGAAGLAAYATHQHNSSTHEHSHSHTHTHSHSHGTSQHHSASGASNGHQNNGLPPSAYVSGGMAQHHQHTGPVSRFVDWWKDYEDVQKMEEYTEYIGVCKGCFDPRSSVLDAPRKHHYYKRRSNEFMRPSGGIEKQSRYNLKEKRSQNSISGEERRKTSNSAAGWMAAGLGGLGLAKAGKAVWNTARDDFDDTYSIKSGRSRVSRRSSSRSLDRKGYSYGYTGVRHRSRSGDRMSNMSVGVTGDRKDRKAHKSRRHSRASSSSSSSSDNGKSGLIGAAIGAGLAGAALGASASKKRHARSKSPKRVHVVHPRRDSNDDERSRRSQQLRHKVSRSSTSGASVIEIGQNHEHEGGFFQGFFSAPPPKEKRVKPASLKKKKGGFFNFTNASTSSTDSDMAFGTGYVRRRRRSSHSRRPSPKRRNSDERLKASLIGLGATAAAITAAKAGKGKRSRDVSVVKENRKSLRDSQSSRTGSRYGDDEWEDLPDDGPSDSASDGGLVYGEHVLRKSKSNDSMDSNGSGTNKWGWRWGFGKKKRRSSNNLYDNIANTSLIAPAAAGAVGAAAGAAAVGATQGRPDSQSSSAQTLQSVYPVAPHDPNAFFDARRTSSIATSQPLVTSGPGSVSLQQPQPMHQVHGTVYTTQAPPPASYNAPTGPPVFSQVPPQPQAQNIIINNSNNQFPQQPPLRRANSSPIQTSSWRRDAAIAGLAATAGAAAISALKSDRPPSASSNVRFDLTQTQTEKEMRERRRQQERIEEEAQRRREQQRLDDEARWEEEELARREQQRRDDQARRLETARREEEERVRREQQRQEDEVRKAEEERRLTLLRLEESKREDEERRLTLLRQEETRREEERRLILLRQGETKREEEERRLTLLRQEETRREEEERRLALLRQEETKREEDERRRREIQRQQDEARKFMEIERLARLENDRRRDEHELAARQLREAEERERQQRLAFLEHQRQLAIEAAEEERVRRERREAQQQEAERIDAARREAEIQEDLEQRRRGRELQDPSNRFASVQARQLEEQPTGDSIASTATVVQRKEKELKDREREALKPEKKSSSVASAVAAGAAAAIVSGAISSYKDKTKEKEKEKKEKERERKRDRSVKRQSSSSSKSSESKRGKTREPTSVKTIEPSRVEQDMFDEDIFNPDLFKEPTRQDAREVLRDWEDRYSAKPVSQAEFFAPRELLADDNLPKVKPVDPNEGVGDLQMYYAHEDAPSGQPILPPYPPSYSFTATRDGRPTKQRPLPIPVLSLTMPTPPGSRAPSVRSVSPSPVRTREPVRDTKDDYRQEDSNRARSRVSWGENQFHHFDVPTPESFREQFVSDGDLKRQQPNYSTDQVTVEREVPTSAYIPYQPGTPSSSESKETTPSTQYVSDDNSSTWDSVVSASASSKASERNENTPSNSASGSAVSNVSAPPPQSQQDEYDYKRINASLLSNPFSDTNMAPSTIAASLISAPSAISAPSIISAAPSTSSVQTAYYQPEPAFDMRMMPERRTTGPGFVEGEIPDDPMPLHIPGSFEEAEESEPPTPTMESFASAVKNDTKGKTSKSTDSNVVLQDVPRQVEPEPSVVSKSSKGKGVESDTKSSKKDKEKEKDKEKKKKKKSSKASKRISVDTWELDEPSPPTSPILERGPRDIEPRTVEPSHSGGSSRTADHGQDYQPSKSASRSDEGSSAKVSTAALAGGFAALVGTAISQDRDRMASDLERARRNLESVEKPSARDSHSSSANSNRAPEDPAKNVTIPSYAFEGVDELADKTPKRRSEKRSSSSGKWSPSVGSPLRTEMKQEDYMGARNNSDGSKYQPLVEAPKVPTATPFTSTSDPTTSRSVADSGYYAPDDFTHPESNEKESDKSYFASSNGNTRDSQSRASNAERSRRSDDEDDYRRRNSFDDDIGSIASLSYKYEDPDREERRRRRREARSETRDKSRDKSRDYDVGEGEERRRKHRRRETDEGADDWDTRSTYSEARSDVNGERRRRHKRKDSSPDRKTRSRSEAASEYGDLYDEPKSSRRRSRREDDDTASLISSFAGWDDDRSSRKEKDKRSSGLMGLFSSKSRENLAEAASKPSRSRDDDDEERKHRRRRHRSDRGSTYGSDDDDVRSTISSTSRREKRSRSSRSERDGDRADAYDEKVHRSSYMR